MADAPNYLLISFQVTDTVRRRRPHGRRGARGFGVERVWRYLNTKVPTSYVKAVSE